MFGNNINNKNENLSSLKEFFIEDSMDKKKDKTPGFNEERLRNIFENNPQGAAEKKDLKEIERLNENIRVVAQDYRKNLEILAAFSISPEEKKRSRILIQELRLL